MVQMIVIQSVLSPLGTTSEKNPVSRTELSPDVMEMSRKARHDVRLCEYGEESTADSSDENLICPHPPCLCYLCAGHTDRADEGRSYRGIAMVMTIP